MTVTRSGGLALLLAGSATLAACAAIPDLGTRPEIRPVEQLASAQSLSGSPATWPGSGWWKAYEDPQLDRLINEAITGAPDLKGAAARLRQAQGYAQQAHAALVPAIDASTSATLVQQSENQGVPAAFVPDGWKDSGRLGLGFSLDLDLWGKNRAALAAAKADAEGARFEWEEAQLVLATGIAATYADLAKLHAQRDVIAATVANREQSLRLVADRATVGLDNQMALRQARSRLKGMRAELAATDEAIALTRNAIAALMGAGPDRALSITRPTVALETVRGVPADASIALIGRRPDIAAARTQVEASASRIKVARAAFYPNINLSGLIGLQSLGLGDLLKSGSAYGNVGPAVNLPIFHGGALSGQYRTARGQYDEAVARYDAAVVQALREVADVMASRNMLATRLGESRQALDDAQAAYSLARARYERGLSNYLDLLSTEETVLQARRSTAELETRAFTLDIAMIRSLGGGFTTI